MTRYFEAPVASEVAYRQALQAMQAKNDGQLVAGLEVMRCLYAQPGHACTASELARQLGLASYHAANLRIGKFAHALADRLSYVLPNRGNGTPRWWTALAIGEYANPRAPFTFILRPELLAALNALGWLTSTSR